MTDPDDRAEAALGGRASVSTPADDGAEPVSESVPAAAGGPASEDAAGHDSPSLSTETESDAAAPAPAGRRPRRRQRAGSAGASGAADSADGGSDPADSAEGVGRQRRASGAGRSLLPVALLGGLIVLLAAALLVLFLVPAHKTTGVLSGSEQRAVDSARQAAVNLVSFKRASFDADFNRALNSTTGALHDDIAKLRQQTLDNMNKGKFDLTGDVTAAGFESSSPDGTLVLVSVDGYQVDDTGKQTLVSHNRFELTMTQVKGTWLAGNLLYIGLI